eukprot:TRINITY_DN3534_c0_g1_i1.p1 TRINITY_DN3534_c0_g1~~TRINITY_DN3534_c0_g1_i1.p1  ORF type:complete len:417 (-),score=112.29 TRINITY_DN3534_c0_g1_i1:301-1551(-)
MESVEEVVERIGATVGRLKDEFFVSGSVDVPPRLSVTDMEELKGLCEVAPFGLGEETVIDTAVRKVLQTDKVLVEWDQLGEVLNEIQNKLSLDKKLKAQFYKLLLYTEGDFFKTHRDTKRADNHIMTLAVDCGDLDTYNPLEGGELVLYGDSKKEITWPSTGQWAAWYTQIYHHINPVTSGTRIVAIYNILEEQQQTNKTEASEKILYKNESVFPEEIWEIIVGMVQSPWVVPCLSKFFNACWSEEKIIALKIRNEIEKLGLRTKERRKFAGFLMMHSYAFKGDNQVAPSQLIGADKKLYEALLTYHPNSSITLLKAHLIAEKEVEEKPERVVRYRIAQHICKASQIRWRSFYSKGDSKIDVPKDIQPLLNNKKTILKKNLTKFHWGQTLLELDNDTEFLSFPFFGVQWCSRFGDF